MPNYSVIYHGTLFLGETLQQTAGLSLSQRFECKIAVDSSHDITGVLSEGLVGSFSYWAQSIDVLLLENSLCYVHGRFIDRNPSALTRADRNTSDTSSWEISPFLTYA
jgi:hypothetical protein